MENKWQILVVTGNKQSTKVNVPENCTIAHDYTPKSEHYALTCIEGELVIGTNKRLSDYDVVNHGTLCLTATLSGGVWPTFHDLEARPRLLEASDEIQITTSENHPDVFGLDDDSRRAVMSCGHAVAPLSLALYYHNELENGEESINCPDPKCGTSWKFSQIREAACLSTDEGQEFERKALMNSMRKKQNDADRRGKSDNEALQHVLIVLANCQWTEINGVRCPLIRACSVCFLLMQYARGDKCMTCMACKSAFSFICLKPSPCETGPREACGLAPRQTLN